jgi:hypothetical protein
MLYLKMIFFVFLTMSGIHTIFHINDFIQDWYKWFITLVKGIGKTILWIWNKIIGIFKRGK